MNSLVLLHGSPNSSFNGDVLFYLYINFSLLTEKKLCLCDKAVSVVSK